MRQMAGLGRVTRENALERTPKRYDFCDVLVVGSGPAGLSAAVSAAECGVHVMLVEENPRLGGSFCYQSARDPDARRLHAELIAKAQRLSNLELRTSTLAAGYYADHWLALIDSTRMTKSAPAALWSPPAAMSNRPSFATTICRASCSLQPLSA